MLDVDLAELDVVSLGRSRERSREAEPSQRRLGDTLDSRRVGGFAVRMRIVGRAADRDGVLRRPVTGDPYQVQVKRPAEGVETFGDLRLVADAVVLARRREEPVAAAGARRVMVMAMWQR